MPLQLDLKQEELLSLEDAIAYEFFMESVGETMNSAHENDTDILEALVKLAKASYMIASVFCTARDQYSNLPTES